jgi:hypothetical protein
MTRRPLIILAGALTAHPQARCLAVGLMTALALCGCMAGAHSGPAMTPHRQSVSGPPVSATGLPAAGLPAGLTACVTFDSRLGWVTVVSSPTCLPGQLPVDATEGLCPITDPGFGGAGNHRYIRIDPGSACASPVVSVAGYVCEETYTFTGGLALPVDFGSPELNQLGRPVCLGDAAQPVSLTG